MMLHIMENNIFLTAAIPLCKKRSCNVLYSINKQLCISTVIFYIESGHIMATCFDRLRSKHVAIM